MSWGGCPALLVCVRDGNGEGDVCNHGVTEAEGSSGGLGAGPTLLDGIAQGPVQTSYFQGWRSHQLSVPVFVMEKMFFSFHVRWKFFWL